MNNKDFLNAIKESLIFKFEIGGNPNYKLIKTIFDKTFISTNYNRFNQNNKNKLEYIINPNIKDFLKKEKKVFLFTYEYFINIGILLELTNDFFQINIPQFTRILNNSINEINKNIKALDAKKDIFGFAFINNLSVLYIKIKDYFYFFLNAELYGEAKSLSQNLMETSISNISKNTTNIEENFYENNTLLYLLKNSNINKKNILIHLLLYMNFIILKIHKKKIYIEFIPFNILKDDKDETFTQIDFSFYTEDEIQIPMNNNMIWDIFKCSLVYNPKTNKITEKKNENQNLIFPSKTLKKLLI